MASAYICSREKEFLPSSHRITLSNNKVLIPEVTELTASVQIYLKLLIICIQVCAIIQGLEQYSKHSFCL